MGGDGSSSAGTAAPPSPPDGNDDRCWWRYRIANLKKGLGLFLFVQFFYSFSLLFSFTPLCRFVDD